MAASSSSLPLFKPKLWVPGDWNALFGFGTNILVNMLTLSGLLLYVLQMPREMVFESIPLDPSKRKISSVGASVSVLTLLKLKMSPELGAIESTRGPPASPSATKPSVALRPLE